MLYLYKWVYNNGVTYLSVVEIYLVVDSIINTFRSLLRPFSPKSRVSTLIESFWFKKERLILLIFFQNLFFFDLCNLSSREKSGQLFQYANRSYKMSLRSL